MRLAGRAPLVSRPSRKEVARALAVIVSAHHSGAVSEVPRQRGTVGAHWYPGQGWCRLLLGVATRLRRRVVAGSLGKAPDEQPTNQLSRWPGLVEAGARVEAGGVMGRASRTKRERRGAGVVGPVPAVVERLRKAEAPMKPGSFGADALRRFRSASDFRSGRCPLSLAKAREILGDLELEWRVDGYDVGSVTDPVFVGFMWHSYLWRFGRGIYRIDPDLAVELADTDGMQELPMSVISLLPEWALYLELPEPAPVPSGYVFGAMVAVNPYSDPPTLSLLVDVGEGPDAPSSQKVATLALNMPVGEALLRYLAAPDLGAGIWQGPMPFYEPGDPLHPEASMFTQFVPYVLYLCAANADLMEVSMLRERNGLDRRKERQRGEERIVRVGYRVGEALRRSRRLGSGGRPTGRHVSPHLRRAHWHRYWTGSRSDQASRRLELRWQHPILVAGGSEVPVLRTMRMRAAASQPAP